MLPFSRIPRADAFRAFALVGLVVLGCRAEPDAAEAPAPVAKAPVPAVPDDFDEANPVERALRDLVHREASYMLPVGPVHHLRLAEGDGRDVQWVLEGGHCFKVLGVGGAELEEFGLRIVDANAMPLQQTRGRQAVLGNEPLCFEAAGLFRVQAKALRGSGDLALRAYRSR